MQPGELGGGESLHQAALVHHAEEPRRVAGRHSEVGGPADRLARAVDEEMRSEFKIPDPFEATVQDGILKTSHDNSRRFKNRISRKVREGEYKIKKGHEFSLIAELIEAGTLPFAPKPLDPHDLRPAKLEGVLAQLRDYQQEAWDAFTKFGAVGVYWPWGQGKTVLGMYAIAHLRGPKLVVCPTKTLVEQWQSRLRKWLPWELRSDVEIVTYNAWERIRNKQWTLAIFDECHRLPANTFSRLATIPIKYRIGLSATPYREDKRTNFIFALTGYPVGVDWTRFLRDGHITPPKVEVRIAKDWNEKVRMAESEVADVEGKSIIFCDAIDRGRRLASRLSCPHIYGKTKQRLAAIDKADVSVISRVGDEGLSLPDLRKTIEIDFHGASRRQEGQRVGRLLHAEGKTPGKHVVLMTQSEFDRFEGRFMALQEKGFKVRVT
jgi:DNA excision repair protein ERCC-3